jgi:hypothetical protein
MRKDDPGSKIFHFQEPFNSRNEPQTTVGIEDDLNRAGTLSNSRGGAFTMSMTGRKGALPFPARLV